MYKLRLAVPYFRRVEESNALNNTGNLRRVQARAYDIEHCSVGFL